MPEEPRIIGESESPSAPGRAGDAADPPAAAVPVPEYGGRGGPDPTRYGDWEKNGRCIDF